MKASLAVATAVLYVAAFLLDVLRVYPATLVVAAVATLGLVALIIVDWPGDLAIEEPEPVAEPDDWFATPTAPRPVDARVRPAYVRVHGRDRRHGRRWKS